MTDENQVLLEESLSFVIQQQCACDFDTSHFTDSELKCTNGGQQIAFTTSIVYSSPSGAITASDVVEMMQSWAEKDGASLAIGNETGSSAPVTQLCSPSCGSSDETDSTAGVIAGVFFGGLLTGAVLLAIFMIIIW